MTANTKQNASRTMLSWIELDPQGAMLLRQAQSLSLLQAQLQAHTGLKLEVCNLRSQVLVLMASGAMAARLRQQLPSLLRFLRAQGWSVESISIKARPYREPPQSAGTQHRKTLPASGLEALSELRQASLPPALSASVKRLLARAARKTQTVVKPTG
ncbi:MAG: DUF721 domain-containing protein [Betaproteobacteria bacterium]|nr:DUF721 domain-containing protein [Betaproteobacteria bacterium]NBQ09338.1 DUF721 domain-containing protein [Betaproteobacteria bacterium]NCU97453.1 DUF721 domain-containing protein [Betaproteobacteria bacterium]NCV05968.1 DUF721 domain-containing protein [Betaproteobacteria bacterium]NCV56182.1 DUF721 domain-containing protein [Betaproteobacteria bacterium]